MSDQVSFAVDRDDAAAAPALLSSHRPHLRRLHARLSEPLAITPEKLEEIAGVLSARPAGIGNIQSNDPSWYAVGKTAVVPIRGILVLSTRGASAGGGLVSYASIASGLRQALADPNTTSVVLHIESPGGEAGAPIFELADQIHSARGVKPIIALVDENACSAAYLQASAADKIVLGSSLARVGSIGVISRHVDQSRANEMAGITVTTLTIGARKADRDPYAPLSDSGREAILKHMQAIYSEFAGRVSKFRNIPLSTIDQTEAGVFFGADALRLGLADAIQSPGELLQALQTLSTQSRSRDMKTLSLSTSPVTASVTREIPTAGAIDAARIDQVRALAQTHRLSAAEALNLLAMPADQLTLPATPERAAQVSGIAVSHGLSANEALDLLAAPNPVEVFRTHQGAAALQQLRTDEAAAAAHMPALTPVLAAGVRPSNSAPSSRDAMVEALAARMNPSLTPGDRAREYMGHSMIDMAAEMLAVRGVPVRRMNRSAILETAMQRVDAAGYHGTGDFPSLLRAAGQRALLTSYEAAPVAIKALAKRRRAVDFRPLSTLRLSEAPKLLEVQEDGEVQFGTMGEAKETYSVRTFARIFGLTRTAILNDDMGAFADWAQRMGAAATETEAAQLVTLLTDNDGLGATMDDGKSLFHADHHNLAVAGTALSVTALGAGRRALREQTGLDGETPINATPRYLLVGPALETVAEQVLSEIYAATAADANPFTGKLTLLVEPRLKGNSWRLFADPAACPVLEQAYLQDQDGPQLMTREGFDTMGIEFRVSLDVGAGVVDHRGAYQNPGA